MPQRSAAPALVRSAACLQAPGIPRMDSITLARAQMGLSLAFHILFSALGVGLPLLPLTGTGAFAQYPHLALAAPPSAPPASPVQSWSTLPSASHLRALGDSRGPSFVFETSGGRHPRRGCTRLASDRSGGGGAALPRRAAVAETLRRVPASELSLGVTERDKSVHRRGQLGEILEHESVQEQVKGRRAAEGGE